MQNGSLVRSERQRGPDIWEFRWRELAGNGKRTHRGIVLGSVNRLVDDAAARQAVPAFYIDINSSDARGLLVRGNGNLRSYWYPPPQRMLRFNSE